MNQWKNYLWMVAGLAALAVVGAFTAKPLLAQVRAAFVENVDEPGRSPYSSSVFLDGTQCSGGGMCDVNVLFAQVPTGKRLIAANITGQINVATPGVIAELRLFAFGAKGQLFFPTVLLAGTLDGSNMIGVNAATLAFFDAGMQPELNVLSTTPIATVGFSGQVTLSGHLIDCTVSSPCAAIVP